jgi:hypothetical protein
MGQENCSIALHIAALRPLISTCNLCPGLRGHHSAYLFWLQDFIPFKPTAAILGLAYWGPIRV